MSNDTNRQLFESLVSEAIQLDFFGWDFSFISHRWREEQPKWDYRQIVLDKIRHVDSLLDMGTGGGEFLSTLQPFPEHTFATESFQPNISVARARLEPLGIHLVEIKMDGKMPFGDEQFALIINRHDSFSAREVYRSLKSGGNFITQQVGGKNNIQINELLQERPDFEFAYWTLQHASQQLEDAGFQIINQKEDFLTTTFTDIGAVVFYLKAIPWQIPDFAVEKYYEKLFSIHNRIQKNGELAIKGHRFCIQALKE